VVLAGGGIKKGMESTVVGLHPLLKPQDKPVGSRRLAMTIYNRLGITAIKKIMSPAGGRSISSSREVCWMRLGFFEVLLSD